MGKMRIAGLVLLALLASTAALYEDQVGIDNWLQQHVGRVHEAHVSGRRVFVTTDQNVLAALHLKTGDVAWRQIFGEADVIDHMIVTASAVYTLSRGGGQLRAWGVQEGDLLWEHQLFPGAPDVESSSQAQLLQLGEKELLVLARNTIQNRRLSNGDGIWAADVSRAHSGVELQRVELLAGKAHVLGLKAGDLFAAAVDTHSGALSAAGTASVDADADSFGFIGTADGAHSAAVVLDKQARLLAVSTTAAPRAGSAQALFGAGGLLGGLERPSGSLSLRSLGYGLTALEAAGTGAVAVLDMDASGKPRAARVFESGAAVSAHSDKDTEKNAGAVLLSAAAAGAGSVRVLVMRGEQELHSYSYAAGAHVAGPPALARLGSTLQKNGTTAYRALVMTTDLVLQLSLRGQVAWSRHEALAQVTSAHFSELPEQASRAGAAEAAHELADRMRMQVLAAKQAFRLGTEEDTQELQSLRRSGGGKLRASRDANGFRQAIVALTACGKVYALHNGDGRVLWTYTPAVAPTTALQWRHHGHGAHPLLLLVAPDAAAGATQLTWLDQYTGVEQGTARVGIAATRVVPLPDHDAEGRRVLLLWNAAQGTVAVFPETPDAAAAAAARVKNTLVLHSVDEAGGAAAGYSLLPAPAPAAAACDGLRWATAPLWGVKFSGRVLSVAAPSDSQAVSTRTRVLGDRSMLFKYLSPNTLFIAAAAPPSPASLAAGENDPSLEVTLLDAATGQVLYRVRHAAAQGPVKAVFAENWVVYSYWNVAAARAEVSVLEMFQETAGAGAHLPTAILRAVVGGNVSVPEQSSLAPPPLRIMGQSYYMGPEVKVLGVTATAQGVTGRQVLMGTLADHIVAMDRRFLDPRRPLKPSRDDQEEGLVPYGEWLPLFPHSFVSGSQKVAKLRGFAVAPARVESTCLMFAHGLDLYYTRLAPNQTYDLIGDEFSYALLALTLAALTVGTAVLSRMVTRDELQRRWR